MHVAARHASAIVARLIYLSKLRDSALRRFERGDATARMRAGIVAREVAGDIGVEDSPLFRADLTTALRGAGWRDVRVDNVRLWKGVVRR